MFWLLTLGSLRESKRFTGAFFTSTCTRRLACCWPQKGGATEIVIEHDEDVEVVLSNRRIYVQVKTRSEPLIYSDIEGAIRRFEAIRKEHQSGRRMGKASFAIATNAPPGPGLAKRLGYGTWPADVALHWPEGPDIADEAMPKPWHTTSEAFAACCELAGSLPFAMLAPETLAWKLAGRIMSATAGVAPHEDHTFTTAGLPELFEQLVVQLQDFPAPPPRYRSQDQERPLLSDQRVRLITGYSGAGKTSWVSHTAMHTTDYVSYFNVSDVPSTALVTTVAREMAARLFGEGSGKLGEVLLPGASGSQILFAMGRHLAKRNTVATIVIDNAHLVSDGDMRSLIGASEHFRFVLLAQPGAAVAILEARLGIKAEPLRGWTNEMIAAEGAIFGCHGDYAAYERLLGLTAGLPLYVQNALQIAAASYDGSVSRFCAELEEQTHAEATAQELILSRVFDGYGASERQAIGVLSLIDVSLSQKEADRVLQAAVDFDVRAVAALLRKLRETGALHMFGADQVKVHDAMRLLGRAHLESLGAKVLRKAQEALENCLLLGLRQQWTPQRVSLLLRMFIALGKVKPLVEMATDELFHEMGFMAEISAYLDEVTTSDSLPAEDRFWALDGLVFGQFKTGDSVKLDDRLSLMERLATEHNLGATEKLAVSMKRIRFYAANKDRAGVQSAMDAFVEAMPDRPDFLRVARYNFAGALFSLGRYDQCLTITNELIVEYYKHLRLTPAQVMGNNPDKIWPLLSKKKDHTDDLKHLADTLDLQAKALNRMRRHSGLERIHAMKFYAMVNALESFIHVGQDLVDEFVGRADYIGAMAVFEGNLLPTIRKLRMAAYMIPVRSQYAVVLAYAGRFAEAEAEMAGLAPYESGLSEEGKKELQDQRRLIATLKVVTPPPQWQIPHQPGQLGTDASSAVLKVRNANG